jgi:hypothetical protein
MPSQVEQILSTILASAVGTAIAGTLGIRYGLSKLRKERAFEKRLQWYESAVKELIDASEKVHAATNAAWHGGPPGDAAGVYAESAPVLARILRMKTEAHLYASSSAYEAVAEAVGHVELLTITATRLPNGGLPSEPKAALRLFALAAKLMYHASRRLADDVREHLELEPVPKEEIGLYDEDYRQHLADLQARGLMPTEDDYHKDSLKRRAENGGAGMPTAPPE